MLMNPMNSPSEGIQKSPAITDSDSETSEEPECEGRCRVFAKYDSAYSSTGTSLTNFAKDHDHGVM